MKRNARILIVENKISETRLLSNILESFHYKVVRKLSSLEEFITHWPRIEADIVIVDTQLGPDGNEDGWEVIRQLYRDPTTAVLIHTDKEEHRVWSAITETDLIDIVGKPVLPHVWRTNINKMMHKLYKAEVQENFILPDGTKSAEQIMSNFRKPFSINGVVFNYGDVHYIQSNKGAIIVYSSKGEHSFNTSLRDFLDHVKHSNLVRIHNSTIINWDRIKRISPQEVTIIISAEEEVSFNVGQSYKEEVKEMMNILKSKKK